MSTVTRPDLFPAGQAVKAFALPVPMPGELLRNNAGNPEGWKPTLAKLGEPTVAANGALEVPATAAATSVLLAAEVGGAWRYLTARGEAGGAVSSSSPGKVKVKTTTTTLLAANPNRTGLSVENVGPTNVIYLGLGAPAVLEEGIGPIVVNGSWNGLIGGQLWKGSVTAIAASAEVTATVVEV